MAEAGARAQEEISIEPCMCWPNLAKPEERELNSYGTGMYQLPWRARERRNPKTSPPNSRGRESFSLFMFCFSHLMHTHARGENENK